MIIDSHLLETLTAQVNATPRLLNVEKDRRHSLECLENGNVLFECKDGAYHPLEEDELMVK